jgi:hypothetical protein
VYRESAQQIDKYSRCGLTPHSRCHWIAGDFSRRHSNLELN